MWPDTMGKLADLDVCIHHGSRLAELCTKQRHDLNVAYAEGVELVSIQIIRFKILQVFHMPMMGLG